MKYDLMGSTLNGYNPVINRMAEIQEMQDMIIPDSMPDIGRIIGCSAEGSIREKEITENGVRVCGTIRCDALFTDQEGREAYSLPVVLPLSYFFEREGIDPQSVVFADINIIAGEAREVNPRKLSVRCVAAMVCRVFEPEQTEIIEEIPGSDGIEFLNRKVYLNYPTAACVKPFTINETLDLPSEKQGIAGIITHNCTPLDLEYKLIQNKAIVKGAMQIDMLYNPAGGGTPENTVFEIPFSQIVDIEGVDESCSLSPDVVMLGCDVTQQMGGGAAGRSVDVGLYLELQLLGCCEREITPIIDAYSCEHDLEITTGTLDLTDVAMAEAAPINVREAIESVRPMKSILYAEVNMSPATEDLADGEHVLDSTANILVIYTCDDEQIYGLTRRIKVPLPQSDDYLPEDICLEADNVEYSISLNGNMEIRFTVKIDFLKFRENVTEVVNGIEYDPEAATDYKNRPSVILRYPAEGERFWDIAKGYRTTMGAIYAANGLEPSEIAPQGRLLLIPRK